MMLPIALEHDWLKAGSRGLVKYRGEGRQCERFFLWPKNADQWLVHTPNDTTKFEHLNDYELLKEMTGQDSYPRDVESVEAYSEVVENGEMVELIQKGRKAARSARESAYEVHEYPRMVAVDWEGRPRARAGAAGTA